MPEPKLANEEAALESAKTEAAQNPEGAQPTNPLTPAQQAYWAWVQRNKTLDVSDIAIFGVGGGLVAVPTDALGRPLLDSSLYLRPEVLKKLLDAAESAEDAGKAQGK